MEKRLVMANTPQILKYLQKELKYEFSKGKVEFHEVRNLISSPRLFDMYVRGASIELLAAAGSTYLDQHTMLADRHQKTYAVSIEKWKEIEKTTEVIADFKPLDKTVSNIQVWPYEPSSLDDEQFCIAVALSFTRAELLYEYRICGALDTLLESYGFIVDEPHY
ncbi:hypothetical protein ACYZT4_26475 [Pseudomonas sp. GB2N2]